MATARELDTLAKYSTPGLRRGELTREAKRDQLASLKISGKGADEVLDRLYPVDLPPNAGEGEV